MLQVFEVMAWVEHGDVVVHKLEGISVAGQYQRVIAGVVSHSGESGDDVIALIPLLFDIRDAQGLEHALNQRQLGKQLLGRGLTGALVLREHVVAERAALHIEGYT